MIPIFAADGKTRLGHSYNGLTLNDPTDEKNDLFEADRIVPQSQYQSSAEANAHRDGIEVYSAFKRARFFRYIGMLRSPSKGRLYDRAEELAAATDPAVLSRDNPDTQGFLPFDFSIPTADTTNFPDGLMPCRYYFRPMETAEPDVERYSGLSVPFAINFMARDPRRYLQTPSQLTGEGAADNSLATTWSWPLLTIAMTGSGADNFTIRSTEADKELVLDLSGLVDQDSVVVDMEHKSIKVNGEDESSRYVSGEYLTIEPGINTIDVQHGASASPTLTWRSAFTN